MQARQQTTLSRESLLAVQMFEVMHRERKPDWHGFRFANIKHKMEE
jgi:hypothetical protein